MCRQYQYICHCIFKQTAVVLTSVPAVSIRRHCICKQTAVVLTSVPAVSIHLSLYLQANSSRLNKCAGSINTFITGSARQQQQLSCPQSRMEITEEYMCCKKETEGKNMHSLCSCHQCRSYLLSMLFLFAVNVVPAYVVLCSCNFYWV